MYATTTTSVLFCLSCFQCSSALKAVRFTSTGVHACDVPCANPASRDRRSPLRNQMFIAEEPILVNTFFSIFRPYGMYEAMYQTRAHLRPKVKPRIAPYKTRQTLPGCRAPLNANEEEHEGLWAARKSANHRGNLRRPRIGVCWRQGTLVSAEGYGVPSRRYRPPSLALASPGTSACTVSSVRSESCHMHPGVCARRCEERGLQERGRVLLRAYPVLQSATTFPRV